jgi:transposase
VLKGLMVASGHPVVSCPRKRQYRVAEEKRRIVEETLRSDESVAVVARRHGVNANQVFQWRKLYQAGLLGSSAEAEAGVRLLPVTVDDDAKGDAALHELSAGAIHIELPGHALVSLEGHVELEMIRAVLECLRR